MADRDSAPGRYCCLHRDCGHPREQVFNGGGDEEPVPEEGQAPEVRYVQSADRAVSGDNIS